MSTALQGFPDQETVHADSDAIRSYSSKLSSVTVTEAGGAASTVRRLGNGDINAFGVCLAQVMGIPSQTALGVAARHLERLSGELEDFAADLRHVADLYEQIEQDNLLVAHGVAGSC